MSFLKFVLSLVFACFVGLALCQGNDRKAVDFGNIKSKQVSNPLLNVLQDNVGEVIDVTLKSEGLFELSERLKFIGLLNDRNKFFLPSENNFVGVLQFKQLLLDTGCTGLSLALRSVWDIDSLADAYPPSQNFDWRLSKGKSAYGVSYNLVLSKRHYLFPVKINGTEVISLQHLVFRLCVEDAEYLYEHYLEFFDRKQALDLFNPKKNYPVERSTVNLVGQDILQDFLCLQYLKLFMCFDLAAPKEAFASFTWQDINTLYNDRLGSLEESKPPDFHLWTMDLFPETFLGSGEGLVCNGKCFTKK